MIFLEKGKRDHETLELIDKWFEHNFDLTKEEYEKIRGDGRILLKRKDRVNQLRLNLLGWKQMIEQDPEKFKENKFLMEEFNRTKELFKFYNGAEIEELKDFEKLKEGGAKE